MFILTPDVRMITQNKRNDKDALDAGPKRLPLPVFMCPDDDLLSAAQAAGLLTENPNAYL